MHKVLAIETSCDETSVSIVSNIGDTFRIHSNIIASQIEDCLLYTSPSPRDRTRSRMPSSA